MLYSYIDLFCNYLRISLYFLLNHWLLSFLGISIFLLFSQTICSLFFLNLDYAIWRVFGGLRAILLSANKEHVWELFDLTNPYPMQVGTSKKFLTNLTLLEDGPYEGSNYIKLAESIKLINPDSLSPEAQTTLQTVEVRIHKFFPVNPRHIYRGCHSRYSLAKSIFIDRTFGGDPACGGGLKNLTPPRWQEILEYVRLGLLLRKKTISGFFLESLDNGSSGVFFYKVPGRIPTGFIDFFLGDESQIAQRAVTEKAILRPVEIILA